jgi:hypothetical protein
MLSGARRDHKRSPRNPTVKRERSNCERLVGYLDIMSRWPVIREVACADNVVGLRILEAAHLFPFLDGLLPLLPSVACL